MLVWITLLFPFSALSVTVPTENLVFGMDPTWFVLISVCIILISFAFLVGIAICLCRRAPVSNNSTMNGNNHPANGNGNFNSHSRELSSADVVYGGQRDSQCGFVNFQWIEKKTRSQHQSHWTFFTHKFCLCTTPKNWFSIVFPLLSLHPFALFSVSNQHNGDKHETFDAATRTNNTAVDRKDVLARERWNEWQPSSHDTEKLQSELGGDIDRWTIDESQVTDGTGHVTADKQSTDEGRVVCVGWARSKRREHVND